MSCEKIITHENEVKQDSGLHMNNPTIIVRYLPMQKTDALINIIAVRHISVLYPC